MTEIVRRSPSELRILETHPGNGLYDCLAIMDTSGRRLAGLNRSGTLQFFETLEGKAIAKTQAHFFEKLFAEGNLPKAVNQICRELKVPAYKALPPTTRESLVYRFIAALLESSVLSKRTWECRSGYFETTGLGAGTRADFRAFPLARKHLKASAKGKQAPLPKAHDYWFIQVDGESELCLSLDALAWDKDFNVVDLFAEYKIKRRIWPLIFNTAGFLLG